MADAAGFFVASPCLGGAPVTTLPSPLFVAAAFAFTSLVGGETCPAPADVEQRVRAILHLSSEQQLDESFIVERHEAGLFVELRSVDSTSIGQRTLPTEGSCDELAQAAAVVLSAWLTDVHPDFAGALPTPPEPDAEPAPEPAPEPPPQPAPAPKPELPAPVQRRTPPLRPRAIHQLELSLAGGADLSGSKLAVAGLASVAYVPSDSGWGVRALTLVDAARRQPLGAGAVLWRRWPLGLGPALRLAAASAVWDFSAGPALCWVRLAGRDFDDNATRDAPSWAGFLSLRLASRGRWGVFGQALGQVYLGDTAAYERDAEYPLPRFSLAVLFGAHWSP